MLHSVTMVKTADNKEMWLRSLGWLWPASPAVNYGALHYGHFENDKKAALPLPLKVFPWTVMGSECHIFVQMSKEMLSLYTGSQVSHVSLKLSVIWLSLRTGQMTHWSPHRKVLLLRTHLASSASRPFLMWRLWRMSSLCKFTTASKQQQKILTPSASPSPINIKRGSIMGCSDEPSNSLK